MIPDELDHATAALRAAAVPAGPPADLAAATLAAVTARCHQTVPSRRRVVMRILGYGSLATAAAVLIGTAAVFLATPTVTAAAEFKAAMENAARAKNLVATTTQKLTPNSPELKLRMTAQGPYVRTEILNPGGPAGAPTPRDLPVIVTMVIDQTRNAALQLNHAARTAQFEDLPNRPGDSGYPDLVAGFRNLAKAEGIAAAGEEAVDNVTAKKYTLPSAEFLGGKGPCDVTVWIDPKTALPVKVRLQFDVPKRVDGKLVPSGDKSDIVFEDFRFDVKLPDDTFSFDPPKGYAVRRVERARDGTTTPKK